MVLKILIALVTTIAAPPSKVFAQVNDFHKWDAWSPWAKLDPNAKTTFEGKGNHLLAFRQKLASHSTRSKS